MIRNFPRAHRILLELAIAAFPLHALAQASSIVKNECPGTCAVPSAAGDAAGLTPSEFQLGVGDVVHISVWREPELTQTAVVSPDGRISMPLVGDVQVAGKSSVDAGSLIRSLLLKYVSDPEVTV
jgi:protein involved in polysaccharide export with SLBB domain